MARKRGILKQKAVSELETVKRYYRIERKEIGFLKFIIEAYEGIATLTTIDSQHGLVVLRIAPDCEGEVNQIINALGEQIRIEPQPASVALTT